MNRIESITMQIPAGGGTTRRRFHHQTLVPLWALLCGVALSVGSTAAQETPPATQEQDNQEAQPGQAGQATAPKQQAEPKGESTKHVQRRAARRSRRPAKPPTKTPTGPVTGAPGIRCEETIHDFGLQWAGGKLQHDFIIRNEGDQVLQILSVRPGCGCTIAKGYDKEIPPGGTGKIPVVLNTAKVGKEFTKSITVSCNDPVTPALRLQITGTIKAYVAVEPPNLSIGHVTEDASATKVVMLTNNTQGPLEITLESDKSGPFVAQLIEQKPGMVYQLRVTATPPFQPKLNKGEFVLQTNIKEQPSIKVPVSAYVPPRLNLRPEVVYLPATVDRELTRRIKFTNNGDKPVKILTADVDDSQLGIELTASDEGKKYDIRLTIPAGYQPPDDHKTITLTTDDPQKPRLTIPIRSARERQPPAFKLVGKMAPAAEFTTVGGQVVRTGVETGKVTLLDFYASWCPHSRRQVAQLAKLFKEKYADNPDVLFLGVSQDALKRKGVTRKRTRTPEQIAEMWAKVEATFGYALDPKSQGKAKFLVTDYPTAVLLDKDGKIQAVHVGASSGLATTLERQIGQLLAGEALSDAAEPVLPPPDPKASVRGARRSARPRRLDGPRDLGYGAVRGAKPRRPLAKPVPPPGEKEQAAQNAEPAHADESATNADNTNQKKDDVGGEP